MYEEPILKASFSRDRQREKINPNVKICTAFLLFDIKIWESFKWGKFQILTTFLNSNHSLPLGIDVKSNRDKLPLLRLHFFEAIFLSFKL